jgi:hypothetical protein
MRKLFLVAGILLAAACADRTTNPEQQRDLGPARDLAPGCQVLSYADLQTLINQVYGAGTPDANAALGKLQNVQHQLSLGDVATAQDRAWDLVEFTVGKYKAGTLIAPESLVMELVNGLLCYAGLAPYYSTIDNSWIVRPGDLPQILVSDDGWAGLSLPANP